MKNAQAKVAEFMAVKDPGLPKTPTIPPTNTQQLQLRLLKEELEELDDALLAGGIVETADAIGDLLYLVLNTAVVCGIDIEPVFNEIHRSNMTKFIGGIQYRADGKIIKGPHYEPPKLAPIIAEQSRV